MPVRTYESKFFGGPHNMTVNGCTLETDDDIEKVNKSLVFVDLNTGLNNRSIVRDPICGLGDLPPEIDILQGCALKRVNKSSESNGLSPIRDPILLKGDLGAEYNCLYTTKDLTCKHINDRNIITLEGNLGDELDSIRPHGGRPRSNIKNEAIRNPITGSGDFGSKEWDPIWKYDGRHVINRPEQVKRDPVTHSVPMANMGESIPNFHYKHFNVEKDTDVISHNDSIKDNRNTDSMSLSSIRHYNDQESRNPITHTATSGCPEDKPYRSGTKHFYDQIKNEDHIRHHGFTDDIIEQNAKQEYARQQAKCRVTNDPIGHYGFNDDLKKEDVKRSQSHSTDRVLRNPISGIGIKDSETMTVLIFPDDYSFRSFRKPKNCEKTNLNQPNGIRVKK